jgi:hypothetical protein
MPNVLNGVDSVQRSWEAPLPATFDDQEFTALTAASRDLHGHMCVLPVAVWIARDGEPVVTVSEALRGLAGRVDRPRIMEALKRLEAIGALSELPRIGPANAPRQFERIKESAYWDFADSYSEERTSVGI